MSVLTNEQIKDGYFSIIGGFPPDAIVRELKEYKGQKRLCVACTQLPPPLATEYFGVKGYTALEQKRILDEWVDFFQTNIKALKALHFNSHVPQRLFDAACHQENLEEFRCKWGNYKDLSALEKMRKLKFLYLGHCPSVESISPLTQLHDLVVLYVNGFKRIENYSPLTVLANLEQLEIGALGFDTTLVKIQDLEFLRDMPNLLSFWKPGTRLIRKYSKDELIALENALPNLSYLYDSGL